MTDKSIPVEQLRNVGPTIARRLREVDIRTKYELRTVGPVTAYRRICAKYPGRTIPVCYYLYSLEGALRDEHWDALGPRVKKQLLDQVSPNKRLQRTPASGRPLQARRYAAPGAQLNFEWDPNKAVTNLEKHGISFDEASTAFFDPLSSTVLDPRHSDDEARFVLVGLTYAGRLVVVFHTDRGEALRLISARPATRRERRIYEQQT